MRSIIISLLFAALSFCQSSFGQSERGSISGMVQDPWGAALTVATVEAKNVATGSVSKAPSSAAGKYTLADLPPGVYDISVAVPAARPFPHKGGTVGGGEGPAQDPRQCE